MRTIAAKFQNVTESFRCLLAPALKDRGRGKAVKRVVDLYRVEVPGIVKKPVLFGQLLGIETSFPVIILVSRSANA